MLRRCLRDPVPEIAEAALYLDDAVTAHLAGNTERAAELICLADMPAIRDWTESLWGPGGPHARPRVQVIRDVVPTKLVARRMPNASEKRILLERDGYHCRWCGIPVIRAEVRTRIREHYPRALRRGGTNASQHAGFQAMWVQYDHVLPHAHGGTNDLDNLVISCAPCNYGRTDRTLEEVELLDPRQRAPVVSSWDGLERILEPG